MSGRAIRAARKACVKRHLSEPVDFDMPEPIPVEPMTAEQRSDYALEYQQDAIAENTSPFIPGNY